MQLEKSLINDGNVETCRTCGNTVELRVKYTHTRENREMYQLGLSRNIVHTVLISGHRDVSSEGE